jgi:hypothetical protein
MNKLRKIFTASVMVMTLAVMLGFGSFAHAATPQAGDLIKMDGLSTVYFLGNDSKRYVFPHESVFFSWHRDFSGVVTVSASELQSYPLGANITMRPGTKLVKITTDPSVYAVEPNGVLRKIQSESDAIAIYGPNWNKRVVDVADSFFTNYTIGKPLASGEIAAGTLVKNADDATVYYFDGTNYRPVASESAFYANRFSFNDVITISKEITPKANAITNNEFAYDAQNATGPVTTASGVTVSLSSATPAAASLVASQALAPLVSVNLTAANDGAVTLKSIKFKKAGIASDSSFSNLYLYDGNTRLTDGSSMSNGYVNFSGASLVTIPAGQTKTLTVKADIDAAANTGNIGLSLVAATDVVSTGATVNGSFPINGNLMSLFAKPADMSTVALSSSTAAASPIKAGTLNAVIWAVNANVTNKPVDFKYLALQQVGSIQKDDLANFAIYVDGIKAGDGALNANNELIFDLNSKAYRMNTGNHVIEVKADIVKGSSRTFSLQMQTKANAVFTDTNYNVNVAPSATVNGTSYTISSGSVTVSADSTFNATEIVKSASNAILARFTMKAWGEDVKINQLKASIDLAGTSSATTTEGMNDVAIYVDGNQVGSSQSFTIATGTVDPAPRELTFGSSNLFTIEAGKQVVVEVRGSLSLDNSYNTLTSVKTDLKALTGNAQGVTSYDVIGVPTGDVTGKTLNIVSGSVTVSENGSLQDMNVSKNSQKVKIGSYILSASSAEGVIISNIKVGLTVASGTNVLDNMSNLYVSENTTPVQPQGTNDFNVNLTLAANATKVIDVYVDLNELTNTDSFSTSMQVTYRTDKTMNSGTTASVAGQTMTVATGSLGTPSLVSTPNSFFVLGGSTAVAANYKFVANNADAYINELKFTNISSGINQIMIGDASAAVVGNEATVSGLNIKIPAGTQGANVEVKAVYNNVTSAGQGGMTTGQTQKFTLGAYKYTVNGTQADATANIDSKEMKLVASYPAVVNAMTYTDTTLKIGPKTEVMRFTVTATGNSLVNLKQIVLNPSYNYDVATTTGGVSIYDAADLGTKLGSTTMTTSGVNMYLPFDSEVTIDKGAAKTFVVYANTTGTLTNGTNYFGLSLVNAGANATSTSWAWNDGTIAGHDINGLHIAEFTGTTFSLSN